MKTWTFAFILLWTLNALPAGADTFNPKTVYKAARARFSLYLYIKTDWMISIQLNSHIF